MDNENEKLVQLAYKARKNSYSPYSDFPVGAALLTAGGNTYTGVNVESGVNDLSICAERVALFKAVSEGEREFEKIAVACGGEFCTPCGACRQTLIEHAPDLEVVMADLEGNYRIEKLEKLLPEAFRFEE